MIEVQLEVGNRWAYIATFIKGRTENQVKNRFKTLLKKYMLSTYGKGFYENYVKEVANRDENEYPWRNDQVVLALLEEKKNEQSNMKGKSMMNQNMQLSDDNNPLVNANIVDSLAAGSLSAFQKVDSNFAAYSRNASTLHAMNSQPVYMNHSLDYLQEGKNLNYESINLNNSMRSFNSVNSGMDQQNLSMTNYPVNNNQNMNLLNPGQSSEQKKHGGRKQSKNNDSVMKSTIPRTFIDLGAEMSNKSASKSDSNNLSGNANAQMENAASFPTNNMDNKNGGSDDVNMDAVSNSNANMNYQSMGMNQEPSLFEIKQMAVRKFIDSNNDENLYIMQDGSMVVECIKTSQMKILSHSTELTMTLRQAMN